MSAADTLTKIVCISDLSETLDQVNSAFETQNEFKLVRNLKDVENIGRVIHDLQPDILLVDYQLNGQATIDIIDELALKHPNTALVAILENDDTVNVQQVIHAGARAFLIQPFSQVNLLSTLRRVRDISIRQRQSLSPITVQEPKDIKPIDTISIFSPRGGVGSTTVATNLAIAMHKESNSRVLLMEGKLFFGHLDVMLNLRTQSSLADLIPHSSSLDEMLVQDVVDKHVSGIFTLVAPSDFEVAQAVKPADLFAIVNGLQNYFDYIVIDAGSNLDENTVTLLDISDRILLVTDPEMAALHDVNRFSRISNSLNYPPDKVLLVLNRSNRPGGVQPKVIEASFQSGIYAQIPDDPMNSIKSLNRGTPLIMSSPRSKASRAFLKMAKQITSMNKNIQVSMTG